MKDLIIIMKHVYYVRLMKTETRKQGKIHIAMGALFEGELEIEKDFEKMLQINGATTLSHLMRTYIITNTALSGMPTITLPMINFVEFFKNAKDSKNK